MLFQADSDYYLSAMPPADLIARAKFSSHTRRNAHGRNNLLSFLALPIRDISFTFCVDTGRRNGDYYVRYGGKEVK